MVCSSGAKTSEPHQLYAWDGKTGNAQGHSALCGICGFALIFDHEYDSAYFNGERCTVCGYPDQSTAEPEKKPNKTTSVETNPDETKPVEITQKETDPVETEPSETQTKETECTESESTQPKPTSETIPKNAAEKDSQHSSSIWVWIAATLVAVGGLGAVVFFLKKKSN